MYPRPPLTTVHVAGLTDGPVRRGAADALRRCHDRRHEALLDRRAVSRAYFGRKDAQQLAVVRAHGRRPQPAGRGGRVPARARGRRARDVEPQRVPLARRTRGAAPVLSRALRGAADAVDRGERDPQRVVDDRPRRSSRPSRASTSSTSKCATPTSSARSTRSTATCCSRWPPASARPASSTTSASRSRSTRSSRSIAACALRMTADPRRRRRLLTVYDVLVLGSGIAGLTTALHAAARGMSVLVLTKGELSHSATRYAQGGVAAAFEDPDSPDLHLADTLQAGRRAVRRRRGPRARHRGPGAGARARRARCPVRHRRARRRRAAPARTGRRPLARAGRARRRRRDRRRDRARAGGRGRAGADRGARRLVRGRADRRGRALRGCASRSARRRRSRSVRADARRARDGGVGQCFAVTTNPTLSTGDGIALALRGRGRVRRSRVRPVPSDRAAPPVDAPTAPLGGAARRGRGAARRATASRSWPACIRSPISRRATSSSRAIHADACGETGTDHVWLDATMIDDFPTTSRRSGTRAGRSGSTRRRTGCRSRRPRTTSRAASSPTSTARRRCRTSGRAARAACSGVHGANRLASNSLLDGLVFGRRVVEAIVAGKHRRPSRPARWPACSTLGDDGDARSRRSRARNRCTRSTPTRCAARCSARCRPTAASSATPPGSQRAASHAARSRDARRRAPARRRSRRTRSAICCASRAAIVAAAPPRARSRVARTRAADFPDTSRRAGSGRFVHAG